ETSLTIDGVRIVIDSGFRRVPVYEPGTGLTTLQTRRVSRAGADQRRGRAGRTSPGIAIRLWNQGQTSALEPFDTPEILAADLSGFALDLASWGVADPSALLFLDPPPAPAWAEATSLLKSLNALDAQGHITQEGKSLARLPLHPRLAHMVIAAAAEDDAQTAAELAVLIGERGLGGDSTDLSHRLDRFRSDRSKRADDARALARRWASQASGQASSKKSASNLAAGYHLARAYPDRVAQAAGPRGKFRLANGRQASLEATDTLAAQPFLVVSDITGPAANGRIRAAAVLDRADLENLFAASILSETTLAFDEPSASVRARRLRRLGAIRLADEPVPVDDMEAAARLLAEAAARRGLDLLPWSREQKAWRARANFLRSTLGDDWPDLSAEALAPTVSDWLAPAFFGLTKLSEITGEHLRTALDLLLPYPRRQEIEALLPSHFTAPTGNAVPIDYTAEGGPAIEIRVQELFGLTRHPTIANGRIRLLLVLLSPAHRPIQTTRDLVGFWNGSWADVAKDLRGRYPRHPWPDEPAKAAPTARAKPRGT
ncbi:MAG TPA: ATP-dependent helicase HrpB, partial [Devosia sp.]|nr:ATP-dependent helicase HrpB [Devosia sp.]